MQSETEAEVHKQKTTKAVNARDKLYPTKSTKMPLSSFCISYLQLSIGLPWSVINLPAETSLTRTEFPWPVGINCRCFLIVGALSTSSFSTGTPPDLNLCSPCACCPGPCELLCAPVRLCPEDSVSLAIHHLCLLQSVCLLFCIGP